MDSDASNNSDVELDDNTHKKLLNSVLNLSYKQHVKKATRTEPTLKISEYDLVKTGKNIHIADLANVLQRKGKQLEISEKIKRTEQKTTTLPKPLEKPHADRIHRTVAYKKIQNELGKWDPIVASMRSSAHTAFPLHSDAKINNKETRADWGYKTDLQKNLEALEPKEEVYVMDDDNEEFPMTMEEFMEKRSEAAKLRAHESFKIAKARRQNKIKSKKYHRIQKNEKIRKQMKEFELLQKTNPEAALEKLEEIERARAEERMSLRHKCTGQWAKSKLIRAKYDKETRQVLAQQLSISRDLTQKLKKVEDSDSEQEADKQGPQEAPNNSDNPWINDKHIKVANEVGNFLSGYRKYWEQQNGVKDDKKIEVEVRTKDKTVSKKINAVVSEPKPKTKKINKQEKVLSTSDWDVTDDSVHDNIDNGNQSDFNANRNLINELNKLDNKMRRKLSEFKAKANKKRTKTGKTPKSLVQKTKISQLDMLTLPKQNVRPVIDEQLDESYNASESTADKLFDSFNALTNNENSKTASQTQESNEIDPNKFINMNAKPTQLDTAIPDLMAFEDNEDTDQHGVISEAFQDDDIVDDFHKEKRGEIDGSNPKSVDLSLPGWGTWGGTNIKESTKKKKRFIVKFPQKMPRKDRNKGDLIINESANSKVRQHLVSEVPFPFKNVKDFEASIRAGLGSTFVPETVFRRLTKPAVTTKMGTVIEPMSDEVLVKKK